MTGAGRSLAPGRVVVADDNADLRKILVDILHEDGYEVAEMRDGKELIAVKLPGK